MSEPRHLSLTAGEAVVFTTSGPGKEGENEDAAGVFWNDTRGALAVADGVGGHASGAGAAAQLLCSIGKAIDSAPPEADSLRGSVLDGLEHGNQAIRRRGTGAATTLVLAELDAGRLRPYHVGDSGILVVGQRGRRKLLTVPHSPVGYALEAGLLDEEEALHHDDRHLISNAVGMEDMRIEVGSPITLAPRDTVLLASDGLFDNLLLEEIIDIVRAGPLPKVAEELVHRCLARMAGGDEQAPSKPDDVTFLLFRLAKPARG